MSSSREESWMKRLRTGTLKSQSVADHKFMFTDEDLQVMQGSILQDESRRFINMGILAEMGGVQGLSWSLRSHPRDGLYKDEIEGEEFPSTRVSHYHTNTFPKPRIKQFYEYVLECLNDPLLIVLMVAALVSMIVGLIEDPSEGWIEGVAILFAIVLVTAVSSVSNYNQDRQFRLLDAEKDRPTTTVIRGGRRHIVDNEEILVGDVLDLEAGNFIPADGVMVADIGAKIVCNYSGLTGESKGLPTTFNFPFLYAGGSVAEGQCLMLVTQVGANTVYGRIVATLAEEPEETPLQKKLEEAVKLISYIGGGAAILLFIALMIFYFVDGDLSENADKVVEHFITAVTIVVVAVPEGLPLAVSLSLAYSMREMYRDKILVKKLPACETMGNATTVCSDKTGTLTQNMMTVTSVMLGGKNSGDNHLPDEKEITPELRELLVESIVCNSRAYFEPENVKKNLEPERWVWNNGNVTEVALLSWLLRYKVDILKEREDNMNVCKVWPFDSQKKRSSILVQRPDGFRRYYKGAAERMVAMCDRMITQDGQGTEPLDQAAVKAYLDHLTSSGLRTIAFCYSEFDDLERDENGHVVPPPDVKTCVFVGCVGIKDPLRPEARSAVRIVQKGGVIVRMVTGDHIKTATYIAKECGIITDEKEHLALLGSDFREMIANNETKKLESIIPRLRVMARSEPQDKQRLVEWLKDHGDVVAVTGDGTNDAPAFQKANIGIAMNSGTDVAKDTADTVILDDRFSSIVRSIMWGRCVYDNITKFVQFQLTVNLVALALSLIGGFTHYGSPLKAVQLLWVNLIMDTMGALALGTEHPTTELLKRKPYQPKASLISPVMWRNILSQSALQLVFLCILLYQPTWIFTTEDFEQKDVHHYTLVFNTFVFFQFFNEINSRKVGAEINVFDKFFTNIVFLGVLVVTLGFQILMVEVFGKFADTESLSLTEWGICIGLGFVSIPYGYLVRMLVHVDFEAGRVTVPVDAFKGSDLHTLCEKDYLMIKSKKQQAKFQAKEARNTASPLLTKN